MIKNFTTENEEHIIKIVESVTPDSFFGKVGDFFGDIGLTVSGWFGFLSINKYVGNVDEYHWKILDKKNTTVAQIRKIFRTVRDDDTLYGVIQTSNLSTYCDPVNEYLDILCSALGNGTTPINTAFLAFRLHQLKELLRENRRKVPTNPAYSSDKGYYGGRQHGCKNRWKSGDLDFMIQVRNIMHKYFPGLKDKEIKKFLNEMNHHGCHYMAVVNTIFNQYIGREDDFERDFGFPMYDENGHVNSDLVMLDFYARQNKKDGGHSSLEPYEINKQWRAYLKEKNIDVKVKIIDLDIDDFYDQAESGEIIIVYSPLRLRNSSGELVDDRNGGHGTVITGVEIINGKKMYKVSSWGKEYWIDPDDYKNIKGYPVYEQVIYP